MSNQISRQRRRQQEEKERKRQERIEREIHELEEKWKLPQRQQRQQPEKISQLTLEQHDQLLLYTLSTKGRTLEKLDCGKLRIVDILDSMEDFVPEKYKTIIKEIEKRNGHDAASKRFMLLATSRKLKIGWSRQLRITTLDMKDVNKLISPKQADLEDFNKRNVGIPRNSLLDILTDAQRTHCGILRCPMAREDNNSGSVPVVHPELCVSVNHFRKNTAFTYGTYKPSEEGRKTYEDAPRISFNDVTKSNVQTLVSTNQFSSVIRKYHGVFLFLIGTAGSGKTTITKRMVKTWLEEKKMAFLIPFARIDKEEPQSLKNLLIKFVCQWHNHDPSEEEIDEAFNWVLFNQDKCLLIFDGLDQSAFSISNKPIEDPDIHSEFVPGVLMSLLMSRKFLPDCRLIMSSRSHSVANFAPAIQPNIVVVLNDLLIADVEKLMDHYLEHGNASEIMEKLRVKSPRIYQLIYNPLFLRLVAILHNEGRDQVWTYVNTTAKLFFEVIDILQFSAHQASGDMDVEVLFHKLGKMAFEKTMEGKIVFTKKDLKDHGLHGENVQNFLFGVLSSKHNTALLVGLEFLYFNHQSTQEFFSAVFAVEKLTVGEFKKFVRKLFPRLEKNAQGKLVRVREDSFAILRVLVIGCVNEIPCRELDAEEILEKKTFFINSLCVHLRQLFVKNIRSRDAEKHREQMFADMMDFREEGVCREIREHLKDFNFWFEYSFFPLRSLDVAPEGICHFMENFTSNVQQLQLDIRKWNDDEIRRLFQTIQHSSPKIEEMEIWMNSQHLEYLSDVVATFPLLTKKLKLVLNEDDERREFGRKLKEEIDNFDTSNLQNEKLKVEVWDDSLPTKNTLLLAVVLRRGEPPQFTKLLDIIGLNNDKVRKLFQTIQHSSSKIEEMVITMNPPLEHVRDVVATFPHFTRKLTLMLWGGDVDQARFGSNLTEEIINFDTSKLQTEELKVKVLFLEYILIEFKYALDVVLRRGKPPHFTKLHIREYYNDENRKFFQTIQHSSSKIEEMEIWVNPQLLECVNKVVATFPHFTRKLTLVLYRSGYQPEFCRKCKEEIINFDTSKLQTQELKVEVRSVYSCSQSIFEIVLRRGKRPQFIK